MGKRGYLGAAILLVLVIIVIFLISKYSSNLTGYAVFDSESKEKEKSIDVDIPITPDLLGEIIEPKNFSLPDGFKSNGGGGGGNSGGGISRGSNEVKGPIIPLRKNPFFSKFKGGRNTDWEDLPDLSNVCSGLAVIEIPGIGSIRWSGCVDVRGADFDNYIEIISNGIRVDSQFLHSSFNSTAELILEGLPYQNTPVIYKDGAICKEPFCEVISYVGGVLNFRVSSFSAYTTGVNSGMEIWDETDSLRPYSNKIRTPGEQTLFFANYTNLSSGEPILGATCFINFTDTDDVLVYNATKSLYEFSRSFASIGAYEYNITCFAFGFEQLALSDEAFIWELFSSDSRGPNGAEVSVVGSSRGQVDNASNQSAYVGNVTGLLVSGVTNTQSWQGYFGNVSGAILLANNLGDNLYNWSETSPGGEVYASRNPGVDFNEIGCANTTHVSVEEVLMGQLPTDEDSLTSTFSASSHPEFFIGDSQIFANDCSSVNLFDGGGAGNLFYEVILSDNDSIVYASLLEEDSVGFDGRQHDFEMIVAEDGHLGDSYPTPYYFYLELQ